MRDADNGEKGAGSRNVTKRQLQALKNIEWHPLPSPFLAPSFPHSLTPNFLPPSLSLCVPYTHTRARGLDGKRGAGTLGTYECWKRAVHRA